MARDTRQRSIVPTGSEAALMQYYVPFSQVPKPPMAAGDGPHINGLIIRTSGEQAGVPAAVRRLVHEEPTGLYSAVWVRPKEKKLLQDMGEAAAFGQLARAGLAAARYRDKHGKYPERLEQLVPEFLPAMPVDPRDGQGLGVKHFPEITVLYTLQNSPGLDAEKTWNPTRHLGQPVFRLYPRAAAK